MPSEFHFKITFDFEGSLSSKLDAPSMTAEDFSWYQRRLPGMFFFLGVGDTPALHADTFDFDDALLKAGADYFEQLAENFL